LIKIKVELSQSSSDQALVRENSQQTNIHSN